MNDDRRLGQLANDIQEAVVACQAAQDSDGASVTLREYSPRSEWPENQVLFFLKPESFDDGVATDKLVGLVSDKLAEYDLEIGAIRVLGSAYLRESRVIEQHYGVINKIAREGRSALSADAEAKLSDEFSEQLDSDVPVLGGYEAAERYGLSADELQELVDGGASARLASGTYLAEVETGGAKALVLNGFHPAQVEYYTAPGRAILVFEGVTGTEWEKLRTDLLGATDPSKAAEGSIRAELLSRAGEFGLKEVDQGHNALHASAGPVEALAELERFLGVELQETRAGSALLEAGFSSDEVRELMSNSIVDEDKGLSSFDATEEVDTSPAIETLREAAGK
jgi:nucleoside diphosphate kinase